MFRNNKRINNVPELEKELKRVYDRTDETIIQEYIGNQRVVNIETLPPRTHNITGCCDCPFVRSVAVNECDQDGQPYDITEHTFCIWDGTKSDIKQFVAADAVTPGQCPLRSSDIQVTINN